MVVVSLFGGLGNQMFQYAAGKALAERHGVGLVLDLSGFRTYAERPFLLDRLSVPEALCGKVSGKSTNHFVRGLWKQRFDRQLERIGLQRRSVIFGQYSEPHFHYDPEFEFLGPDTALFGYFQSARYFNAISDSLRTCFSLRDPLSAAAAEMSGDIERCGSSVSVHIRRGDYVNPGTAETHGILSEAYYRKAIGSIDAALGGEPRFFVFSDDSAAARQLLSFLPSSRLCFVSGDPERPWEDMALMARCRNHVVANSSFSWWGAWLNPAPRKVVVAPRSWFQATNKRDTRDLYPAGWVLI